MSITIRKSIFAVLVFFSQISSSYASGNISSRHFITDDSLGIVVTQNSTYLMPGQEVEIKVFGTCNGKNKINDVSIAGMGIPLNSDGIAVFKIPSGSIGLHEIPVIVSFENANGQIRRKNHTVRYTVGQANTCVGLDRMNVLYIGIDNPINVAASGAGNDKITVSISGGGSLISKVMPGRYDVKVKNVTDDCRISVYIDGKIAGAYQCRVRSLPVPVGIVGGHTSGDTVVAKAFMVQAGVAAGLKDFPFEIRYEISGFNLSIQDEKGQIKSVSCAGAIFSSETKSLMKEYLKPGTIVTIGNLFAKAPDGRSLKLLPLLYFIK